MQVRISDRVTVVVITRIFRDDEWIRLSRQRGHDIGEGCFRLPGRPTVGRFARPHLVAWDSRVAFGAGRGRTALIVPDRKEAVVFSPRDVGLPVTLGCAIAIQLERRAKGHTVVGRADVERIRGVTIAGVTRVIDVVHHAIVRRGLTPAHVTPVGAAGAKHTGEIRIRAGCPARPGERRTCVGIRPGVAAVGRTIELVDPIGQATALFVHAGEENRSGRPVNSDLDVTNEGAGHLFLSPGRSVVGEANIDALSASKVVPRDIHSAVEGAAWIVVGNARFAVIGCPGMDTEMGPAICIRRSGRLVATNALSTATAIEPHRKPGSGGGLIKHHRVTKGVREWALTIGLG